MVAWGPSSVFLPEDYFLVERPCLNRLFLRVVTGGVSPLLGNVFRVFLWNQFRLPSGMSPSGLRNCRSRGGVCSRGLRVGKPGGAGLFRLPFCSYSKFHGWWPAPLLIAVRIK